MLTDDPGTPGNGKWENNFAVAYEYRPNEWSVDTPQLDLNYGLGEHLQLTLQTAPVVLKRSGHGPVGGLGDAEAAVKWRFLDENRNGVDLSIFPRVIFNVLQSSVRRGLAEDGTRFQIPFQLAKKLGLTEAGVEWGPLVSSVGRAEWLYGVVVGYELTKNNGLMAELHGTSRTNFSREVLTLNFGVRQTLTAHSILIASLGHEICSADQPPAWISYFGVQLLY